MFPTFQGMRLMTNGLAGRPLFGDVHVAYAVIIRVGGRRVWTARVALSAAGVLTHRAAHGRAAT